MMAKPPANNFAVERNGKYIAKWDVYYIGDYLAMDYNVMVILIGFFINMF